MALILVISACIPSWRTLDMNRKNLGRLKIEMSQKLVLAVIKKLRVPKP